MKNIYDKEDVWSLKNIFIRLLAYPICFMFSFIGSYTAYITIFDAEKDTEYFAGTIIAVTLLTLVSIFLYYDIRNIFGKDLGDEEKGMDNILDDEF